MNPVDRLKAAFAANNIPWSDEWLTASRECQIETARYWEDKAESNPFNIGQISRTLSIMAGFPQTGGDGGLTWRQRVKRGGNVENVF